MLFHSAIALLLAPVGAPVEFAQLRIEQRVIIRVPLVRQPRAGQPTPPPEPQEWDEKKGPRCVAIKSVRSAALGGRNSVDLILSNNQRFRARFGKQCRAADFYAGFYIEPTDDGSLCAGRDYIQARSGLTCEVESFKRLVPER
ncbi:hypothetical protein BH11PSE5_BH11PSE5_11400 [soil metagenome]|jgi:hypothetical protein|uniref:hypothetical protein n=1 Tax=unclassified Sphingobium TaxID=2611147 RepID=UPI001EF9C488|nr:hypothetical protein [Sphingobium sp. BS19]GLI97280.1 hypothetical protein Sbs19_10980 [Sphingobium sp. BS19]CAH0351954.1 hypothetical protein SPH9361_01698 [Sphingobium sp. CECT 9361]|tara:strand:+ start:378 stop:806 length:429 start_codon:yes stop_codon:yes gene_type:complete